MITTDPILFRKQLVHQPFQFHNLPEPAKAPVQKARWPELMSISTLAEYLDMSISSVRNLIINGILPDATTAPTPRMKRWKRSVVDETVQRFADRKCSVGRSMTDALRMNVGH